MTLTRRSFLEGTLAAGTFTSLLSGAEVANAAVSPKTPEENLASQSNLPQHDAYQYWSTYLDSVDPSAKFRGPLPKMSVGDRQIEYLHYGPKGLRYVDDIGEGELLDHIGDVQVTMELAGCRPGDDDHKYFQKGAQFRIDCVQTKPYMDLVTPLAWSLMAALKTDQAGKLPSLQSLGFAAPTASNATKILLPSGAGKMGVNLYMTTGESFIDKFVKRALELGQVVAPVMNFPAISLPAIKAVSQIYSAWEEKAAFLMGSPVKYAVATKQAFMDPDREANYLHLLSGDYVLVPSAHINELKPEMQNLEVQQGYLLQKNANQNEPPDVRKNLVAPGVTYAVLKVTVTPVTSTSGGSSKAGEDASTTDAGAGGSASKKPKSTTPTTHASTPRASAGK